MNEKLSYNKNRIVVLLFNTSCIYEIVILNYFLKFAGKDVVFASIDGRAITAMEGYSLNISYALFDINPEDVELLIIPGGNITEINNPNVWNYINSVYSYNGLIAGICAGVDVLDHAGVLKEIESTHSTDLDIVVTDKVITSRANGYVDFAIEVAKKMNLFKDETDLQETIAFWKDYQSLD